MFYADFSFVPDDSADAMLVGIVAGVLLVLFIIRWHNR